jgi:hypothetical protein
MCSPFLHLTWGLRAKLIATGEPPRFCLKPVGGAWHYTLLGVVWCPDREGNGHVSMSEMRPRLYVQSRWFRGPFRIGLVQGGEWKPPQLLAGN